MINYIPLAIGLILILLPIFKKWRGTDRGALIFIGSVLFIYSLLNLGNW